MKLKQKNAMTESEPVSASMGKTSPLKLKANMIETQIIRVNGATRQKKQEQVAVEKMLTLYLNDSEFETVLCSSGQERELAVGRLCAQNIIQGIDELAEIELDVLAGSVWLKTKNTPPVLRQQPPAAELKKLTPLIQGKCSDRTTEGRLTITAPEIRQYIAQLEAQSELFRLTGGVHGGAIAAQNKLEYYTFDIGRLQVLDKIYGHAAIQQIDLSHKVIVFSGRISAEIAIKIGEMGCPVLIGVSAPTSLALTIAQTAGITVIGFARNQRFNIYTCPERVLFPADEQRSCVSVPEQ